MRVFSRVLAALLGWTLLVLCGPSSPAVAAPDAAREPESSKVGGRRNSLGELTAPDEVSAKAVARLTGERVEVVGARSRASILTARLARGWVAQMRDLAERLLSSSLALLQGVRRVSRKSKVT